MKHIALKKTDHRPWKLPSGPWKWRQSWCDLLFAHWPIPTADLRPYVPEALSIQEYDGTSWVGIVPFRMEGVMRRSFPDLPWISAFPELNVRLYVEYEEKPGVWFLSLDATNPLAVWAARRFFYLPYYRAQMNLEKQENSYKYHSTRKEATDVNFKAVYEPTSKPYQADKNSLEHWLTERYCLYAQNSEGYLYRTEVHHLPWPLQKAELEIMTNNMLSPFAIHLPDTSPLLHFSSRVDVVIWPPEKLETSPN
ncbi:MAG: DUF2071 domain-containing protein [Bacteroidetes bacterium]|jgi:uncharacterized protein YqjF (DUF2071 family)|nr:DUF2071 domain-containing protein [Bacteroidota bacterium]